jgi:hypothetical protein
MKRMTAILLSLCIFGSVITGCEGKKKDGSFSKEKTTTVAPETSESAASSDAPTETEPSESISQETEGSEASSESSETSADQPTDPEQAKALDLAGQHGLSEEDLKGEFSLFLKFSETVEGNSGLGDYREFVYLIFPVVADHANYIDDEYFFDMLGMLEIKVGELSIQQSGTYDVSNVITLSETTMKDEKDELPRVLFHELMHFLDWTLNGMKVSVFVVDDKHMKPSDTAYLSLEEQEKVRICPESWIVTEGGAEYLTAKYFTGAPGSYTDCVAFLTGIEYIMGEEYMDKLFFSWDTDAIFQELFFEAGYTSDQYDLASNTLNSTARSDLYDYPDEPASMDDILIDLYTHYKGGNWKEDKDFLAIIKNLNGIGLQGWRRSKNADFIGSIVYQTFEQFEKLENAFIEDIPEEPNLKQVYPTIFMRDGKLYHGSTAELTDPSTGEKYHGYVTYEWDYENDKRVGYEIKSVKPIVEKYF